MTTPGIAERWVAAGTAAADFAVSLALVAGRRNDRWGATEEEAARPLPGDDGVPHPDIATTRAISIHAPVHAVRPWRRRSGRRHGAN